MTPAPVQPAASPLAEHAPTDTHASSPPDENVGTPPPIKSDAYLAGLDKKLVELRIKRTVLLTKYTKQHPDVVEVDRQLEQLRVERSRYIKQKRKQKN